LDSYERKTRLTPGLFGALPIATTITTLGLDKFPVIAGLVGLLSAAGGTFVLSTLVGDVGRDRQQSLFNEWRGAPTTRFLRLHEHTDNPVRRDGWRAAAQKLTGVTLATSAEEMADPTGADQRIDAAAGQLLYLGQEGGVPAVRNENAAFGFQRNVYGFRNAGRSIAAVCTAIQVGAIVGPWQVSTAGCTIGAVVSGGLLLVWLFVPSKERTRLAGERYATQLYIAAQNKAG
jgi:hypothetical protein